MSPSTEDFVLQLAREKRLLSDAQIAAVRTRAAQRSGASPAESPPPEGLPGAGLLAEEQLIALLAEASGVPLARITDETVVADDVLALVPRALAERHGVMPLAREGARLRVATSDPWATQSTDDLAHVSGLEIAPVLASTPQIAALIERSYRKAPVAFAAAATEGRPSAAGDPPTRVEEADDDEAPIIRLVQSIILKAVQQRASDIHLEPLEKRFRVRYRIDGVLFEVESPPPRLQRAIISRVKIMANLSIAEKRLPQDGRIQFTTGGHALDLRVSSLPTAHGESVVMRILDAEGLRIGLPELGLGAGHERQLQQWIDRPEGMVLVTGPTGSGKTTTLYACLHHLNGADRKIITVEEPVEYQLSGINQVPMRPEVGLTFAAALRAILRQAPNIVMVGEIRDLETAEIAIRASLTGHLVFSTLHTNDAAGAVTRLLDLGVKPFLVAGALRGVLAQRLVRKTCETCRQPYAPDPRELRLLGHAPDVPARFQRGVGCPACRGAGYRGRTGIFELLTIDETLQPMIHRRAGTAQLRAHARAQGFRTLRQDGADKAIAGLTTVEEVVSITVGDPG